MNGRPRPTKLPPLGLAAGVAVAFAFALFIAVDTLRAVIPLWSPLPWFDEWATVSLLQSWQEGDVSAAQALVSQHNEHRILVPRLVFIADDLLFRGGGYLTLVAIFAVQLLHAGLFAALLGRARSSGAGRWALAAVVLALMFSLRQGENFSSGFQLQFVAVFAGATLSFVLLAAAVRRHRAGRSIATPFAACLGAVLIATLTMANGLLAGYVVAALALVARLPRRAALLAGVWAILLTVAYLHGYQPVEHHARLADSLRHPLDLLLYVAAYLGSVISANDIGSAEAFGAVGVAATAAAAWRICTGQARPAGLALLGVMLFVGLTAAVTASGRLAFGVEQALSSRYATGSVAFWAAHLCYWWIGPVRRRPVVGAALSREGALGRAAAAALAVLLCSAVAGGQGAAKPRLAVQSFAQNQSADALMLGLDDRAATLRAAWSDEDVRRLLPTLRVDGLSIFGTAEAGAVGRPVSSLGAASAPCSGDFAAAADPSLGDDGVRASGSATAGPRRRLVRRVLLADAAGRLIGFASGAIPGAARGDWRGYAVAPVGASLTAYGRVDGDLCLIGSATVSPPGPSARQASQPEETP